MCRPLGLRGAPKGNQFAKGYKRGKGKKTTEWEQFANWFLSEGMNRLGEEMAKLDGKDLVYTTMGLLEYFKPKLSRSEVQNEHSFPQIEQLESVLRVFAKSPESPQLGEGTVSGRAGQPNSPDGRAV